MNTNIGRRIIMLALAAMIGTSLHAGTAQAYISPSEYYALWNRTQNSQSTTVTSPAPENPANNVNVPEPAPAAGNEQPDNAPVNVNNQNNPGASYQNPVAPTTNSLNTSRFDYYQRIINNRNGYNPGTDTRTTTPANPGSTTPVDNNQATTPENTNPTGGGNTGTPTPSPTTNPGDVGSQSAIEKQMLDLVNQERAKAGLSAFKVDSQLVNLARQKSKDMYQNNYFSHTSPTYGSPYDMEKKAGISYRVMGAENIAKAASVTRAHDLLMNSSGHRANILDTRHTIIGIGIVSTSSGVYVTQLFAGN